MTDIIDKLTQKEGLKENKTLVYQLQKLDELVKLGAQQAKNDISQRAT